MRLYIDGAWLDLSKWGPSHPGGEKILKRFDGKDATDAFFALHSKDACKRLTKLQAAQSVAVKAMPVPRGAECSDLDKAYHELRDRLEREGWFERSFLHEFRLISTIAVLVIVGTCLAWQCPVLSAVLLGLAMQQSGWLGHDMCHSRNSAYCDKVGPWLSAVVAGLDDGWWSEKHNTHHVLTNHVGIDPDIDNRPFLFLWAPPKSMDTAMRPFQHIYFLMLYSLLYVSWRIQSVQRIWAGGDKFEMARMSINYIWLLCLPLSVSIMSILISGFLVAIVVTLSHESEDMKTSHEPSFVKNQFETTRDIVCPDPVTEWLFGGMQYQLEHHLFPTLPRYKYWRLVPVVRRWAKDNGIEYRADGLWGMLCMHVNTLKSVGSTPASDKSLDALSDW
ncbi:delta(6)-fatty-acid desaturase fat-3-like [Sycon ciliatum]|uniref:delta(6)-fatty-acid desaturase fat-3-like n=1 Tax=Sycon ciliatum TaxID=27933 RepID=UPI0020AD2C47|eukprot:scpid69170/ scgid32764/ Fatty acid desaturase 2; Delta(5)/Delta(6) fatty acid desaturase